MRLLIPLFAGAIATILSRGTGPVPASSGSAFALDIAEAYPGLLLARETLEDTWNPRRLDLRADSVKAAMWAVLQPYAKQPEPKAAGDCLGALGVWWKTLSASDQALVVPSVQDQVTQQLAQIAASGDPDGVAGRYVAHLLEVMTEPWGLQAYRHAPAAPEYRLVNAHTSDSLRYRVELLAPLHRDRADLYQLLSVAALARGDTARAVGALRSGMAELYRTGERDRGQYRFAMQLLALDGARANWAAALRDAGDAVFTADRGYKGDPKESVNLDHRFAALYARVYHDTVQSHRVRYLDSLYVRDFMPNGGVRLTPARDPSRGHHVLVTDITWVDCGGCAIRDQGLDAILDQYGQSDVIVLVDHYMPPFVAAGAIMRENDASFQQALRPLADTTRCLIHVDGKCVSRDSLQDMVAAQRPAALYDWVEHVVRPRLLQSRQAHLVLTARSAPGGAIAASVQVDSVLRPAHPLKVQLILVEDSVHYYGGNHVSLWRMIARAAAGDSAAGFGLPLPASGEGQVHTVFGLAGTSAAVLSKNYSVEDWIDQKFSIGEKIHPDAAQHWAEANTLNPSHLGVVAFLQDAVTGEVVETVYQPVS